MHLIERAKMFNRVAHTACRQVRKFSGKPYSTHPEAVMEILRAHVPGATDAMLAAALVHDVDEDTGAGHLVRAYLGDEVADISAGLTNRKVPGLNRAQQKQHDARRLALEPWEVKVIKLCDRLHNFPDIIANDPSHARVYVPETRYLLDTALKGVHDGLWNKLDTIVKSYYVRQEA